MNINKIIESALKDLDSWQEYSGCDDVTYTKYIMPAIIKAYHNALTEDLKAQGINLSPAELKLPHQSI